MVYRGKISAACLPCRKRKLLCDLRADGCSQCARASLACTGYRDPNSLRIRDETAVVRKKAEERKLSATQSIGSLDLSICHQAKDVFYHNYVIGPSKSYSFLEKYYTSGSGNHLLIATIDAVALAYLNYQKHSPKAKAEAQQKYVVALKRTNAALRSKASVTKDSTLLAVLLLDLYEKITASAPGYDTAWTTHLHGALSLVKLRGDEQFRDPGSLNMLIRLSTNMLISCVASDSIIPNELKGLRDAVAARFLEPADPKWKESELMTKYARFKHDMNKGLISDQDIMPTAMAIDLDFQTLSQEVVSSWQYRIVPVKEKTAHHYKTYRHEYPDEYMVQMWNVLRLTRILLNEVILQYKSDAASSSQDYFNTKANDGIETIRLLGDEICATIPQYIGDPEMPLSSISRTREDFFARERRAKAADATQHLPCYRLLFPLYIAARSPWSTSGLKDYAIEQLKYMAETHAIENAAMLAGILESGEKSDPWQVYASLGSYAFVC